MRRRVGRAVVLVVLALAAVSGSAAATPTASPTVLIAGHTYALRVATHGQSVQTVKVVGAATLQKQSVQQSGLKVHLKASAVNEKRSATLIVMFGDGSQERDQLRVYPQAAGAQPGSGRVSKKQLQDAKKYKKLKSNWIQTRVRYIQDPQHPHRKELIYQQLDPTKGEVNASTGIPAGKWVTVPINKQGKPQWLFQTLPGYAAYAAKQSATKHTYRNTIGLEAAAAVLLGWVLAALVLVVRPRLKETRRKYQVGYLTALKYRIQEAT